MFLIKAYFYKKNYYSIYFDSKSKKYECLNDKKTKKKSIYKIKKIDILLPKNRSGIIKIFEYKLFIDTIIKIISTINKTN